MKKLLIAILFIGGIYYFKPALFPGSSSSLAATGSNEEIVVFTYTGCGAYCDKALAMLREKQVPFEHYDIQADKAAEEKWRQMGGGNHFPVIHLGGKKLQGFYPAQLNNELVRVFGVDMLNPRQRQIIEDNISRYGEKKVVMYGAEWCPHCAKARAFFARKDIDYIEIDVEKSDEGMRDYKVLEGTGYPLIYVGVNRFQGFGPNAKKGIVQLL